MSQINDRKEKNSLYPVNKVHKKPQIAGNQDRFSSKDPRLEGNNKQEVDSKVWRRKRGGADA